MLEAIVERLPPPKGEANAPLKALLIDSWYDAYLGVVVLVRIIDGKLKKGQRIKLMASGGAYQVERVGIFRPKQEMLPELGPGEVGFFTAAIKQVADTRVGDTVTDERHPTPKALPGFKPAQPVVFCGLFPVDAAQFEDLREAMSRLRLNDASFTYETETSAALGFGFRCGFLGLLHLEIITERLEREFDLELITTAPSVIYHVYLTDGTKLEMHNPADMPEPRTASTASRSRGSRPPSWCRTSTWAPCSKLCQDRRGRQKNLTYVGSRAMLIYELPLNEVVFDFYDRLKSISRGYASFDYHMQGYEPGDLVKMSILVNAEPVDALSDRRAPRARREPRPRHGGEAEGADPAAPVPDPDPGGARRPHHRPRDHPRAEEGRARQVLRRRHHAQAQAAREAEEGQEEDAPVRPGGDPAGGLHRRPEDGRELSR